MEIKEEDKIRSKRRLTRFIKIKNMIKNDEMEDYIEFVNDAQSKT